MYWQSVFQFWRNKANLGELIVATGLVILLKLYSNRRFCGPRPCIWWMTSINNRTPLLYYVKLCATFQSHWWIQTGVTVRKHSIGVKIGDFLPPVTLKFDGWLWKTKVHLFYATPSLMHHFIPISEFKLDLQSWNAQFGSKSMIFFVPCDLEIWQMTLKNKGVPLIRYFKLYASFVDASELKLELQCGNAQFGSKSTIFLCLVTLKFDEWPWKTIGHFSNATSSFVHHFIVMCEFKPELRSVNG